MSYNLSFYEDKVAFALWQTPTEVTERALASGDPGAAYLAWLDARVEALRPRDPSARVGKAERKRIVSAQRAEREACAQLAADVASHRAEVAAFLAAHSRAEWGGG